MWELLQSTVCVTLLCIPGPPTRHVILPKYVAVAVPKGRLMSEAE